MEKLVHLKNINKVFKNHKLISVKKDNYVAVNNVSFDIDKNTIFGLVGESGCGKTTLARSIMLLDPPSSGEVLYDGENLVNLSKKVLHSYRAKMQIVFQDPNNALNPKMSIYNCMKEGFGNRKYPKVDTDKKIRGLLDLVGIPSSHIHRYPYEFSGGQKQRIVIARALSMEPEFLILDEPVSNLDASVKAQIINLLLDLKDRFLLTYLFISHDLSLVSYLSDRIGVMYRGQIVEIAETEKIIKKPLHPYTLKLFSFTSRGDKRNLYKVNSNYRVGLPEGYSYSPSTSYSSFKMLDIEANHSVGCYTLN